MQKRQVGFVCFGEINTPFDKLKTMHKAAITQIRKLNPGAIDAGIVLDDPKYKTAEAAIEILKPQDMDCLIVFVAGWIPTHAVIRVTDVFRNLPMILWGGRGEIDPKSGRIVTTAPQAGTTAIRPAFEDMGYKFKYVYSVLNEKEPLDKIQSYIDAAVAVKRLRKARVGTMGYRDMLLYGTQFEGSSIRSQIGIEVETFEMLEMIQNIEILEPGEIESVIKHVKEKWHFEGSCEEDVIKSGVEYALGIGKKIKERGFDAVTLIDVDGMKKLLGFPPAMVFMLLDSMYGVETIPENDVMGSVTQLILRFITGKTAAYMEYYEFFKNSMLIGVPDYIPEEITDGEIKVQATSFGLLSASLLNVSKVKTGVVTCARLIYRKGKYLMHLYTAEAKEPPGWEEFGWEEPVPQLPSLEVFPTSCSVEDFAQNVSSQHVIISHGDCSEAIRDLCSILDVEVI